MVYLDVPEWFKNINSYTWSIILITNYPLISTNKITKSL
jgi:hypothetical protein